MHASYYFKVNLNVKYIFFCQFESKSKIMIKNRSEKNMLPLFAEEVYPSGTSTSVVLNLGSIEPEGFGESVSRVRLKRF